MQKLTATQPHHRGASRRLWSPCQTTRSSWVSAWVVPLAVVILSSTPVRATTAATNGAVTISPPAVGVLLRPRLQLMGTKPQWGLQMVRPRLRGRIAKATWFLQADLASGQAKLLDARLKFALSDTLDLTVGRFISPFSRAFLTPVPRLVFPDFARPVLNFRVNRDVGMMLSTRLLGGKIKLLAGTFMGTPLKGAGARPVYMGRATVDFGAGVAADMAPYLRGAAPLGVTVGLSGYARPGSGVSSAGMRNGALPGDVTVGADVALQVGSVACMAEVFARLRRQDTTRTPGAAYGQCQGSPQGSDWEAGIRLTVPDYRRSSDMIAEALLTRYLFGSGQGLKAQLRYRLTPGWREGSAASGTTAAAHQVTLQLQLNGWLLGT